jgi:hypothetical protein
VRSIGVHGHATLAYADGDKLASNDYRIDEHLSARMAGIAVLRDKSSTMATIIFGDGQFANRPSPPLLSPSDDTIL